MHRTPTALLVLALVAVPGVTQPPAPNPPLPKVVLIGDSIRLGYAPLVAKRLEGKAVVVSPPANGGDPVEEAPLPVPAWVTGVHLAFMAWTVGNAHYPTLLIGGFLFFLGFSTVTTPYQGRIDLRAPLLVGFFLAGLVIHGGLQGWWIAPFLSRLSEVPLFFGSILLTAFNDNAAITYLASLVPSFTDEMKYAVVAGAVTGGGLTVIANAPNPAGQSILAPCFKEGVSPGKLFVGALIPTIIMGLAFMLLP